MNLLLSRDFLFVVIRFYNPSRTIISVKRERSDIEGLMFLLLAMLLCWVVVPVIVAAAADIVVIIIYVVAVLLWLLLLLLLWTLLSLSLLLLLLLFLLLLLLVSLSVWLWQLKSTSMSHCMFHITNWPLSMSQSIDLFPESWPVLGIGFPARSTHVHHPSTQLREVYVPSGLHFVTGQSCRTDGSRDWHASLSPSSWNWHGVKPGGTSVKNQ